MPDFRYHQNIEKRGDVDFNKRSRFSHTRRRIVLWVCASIGLWPLFWQWGLDDQTVYWAHPVSPPHQVIASNCQACHTSGFQSIGMFFRTPESIRGIEEGACRTCHAQETMDHHTGKLIANETHSCFECHREHRRDGHLLEVADTYCVSCHADLHYRQNGEHAPSRAFVQEIPTFDQHPEFALRRTTPDSSLERLVELQSQPPSERVSSHRALELAILFETSTSESPRYQWQDRSRIRFNHQFHLTEGGVPIPPDHPINHNRPQDEQVKKLELTCGSCHQIDDDGQYMKPILYEQNCKDCHPLSTVVKELHPQPDPHWSPLPQDDLHVSQNVLPEFEPLPHDKLPMIQGILRDRLTRYIQQHPEELKPGRPASLLENKERDQSVPPKQAADWVEHQLSQLKEPALLNQVQRAYPSIARLCQRCHILQESQPANSFGWSVLPPGIPTRWYPHSQFRHDRHQVKSLFDCTSCHYKIAPTPQGQNPRQDPHSIYYSSSAEDVLLPSVTDCQKCHGNSQDASPLGNARSDCVKCHSYHHTSTSIP